MANPEQVRLERMTRDLVSAFKRLAGRIPTNDQVNQIMQRTNAIREQAQKMEGMGILTTEQAGAVIRFATDISRLSNRYFQKMIPAGMFVDVGINFAKNTWELVKGIGEFTKKAAKAALGLAGFLPILILGGVALFVIPKIMPRGKTA